MSLKDMDSAADLRIVMLHYMPVDEKHNYNEVIELLKAYDIDICVYGHLHGTAHEISLNGEKWGIIFHPGQCRFPWFCPEENNRIISGKESTYHKIHQILKEFAAYIEYKIKYGINEFIIL